MEIYTLYTYDNSPELIPLEDYNGGSSWDELVAGAGMDPEDPELVVCQLAKDWNGHRKGAVVITGLTTEGHPFAVENPVGPGPGSDHIG